MMPVRIGLRSRIPVFLSPTWKHSVQSRSPSPPQFSARRIQEFALPLNLANWCVYASYEGNEAVVSRIAGDLQKSSAAAAAVSSQTLDATAEAHRRAVFREAYDWLRWVSPCVTLFRIVLPQLNSTKLAELLHAAQPHSHRSAVLVRASGVVHLALISEKEDASTLHSFQSAATRLFSFAVNNYGHATLMHAPLKLKSFLNVWGPARPDLAMMQRVKDSFDPQHIFAPGRFVGGN